MGEYRRYRRIPHDTGGIPSCRGINTRNAGMELVREREGSEHTGKTHVC